MNENANQNGGKSKKPIIIGAIVGVVVVLLVIIIAVSGKGGKDNQVQNNDSGNSSYSDNSGTDETPAVASQSYYSTNELTTEGGTVEETEETGTKSCMFNNSTEIDEAYIVIDGVKVNLPTTPAEVEQLTGYKIDNPDEQLEAYKLTSVDAKNGDKTITLNITNDTGSALAFKDCETTYISVWYNENGENPEIGTPIGVTIGDKANIQGIIEAVGTPAFYVFASGDNITSGSVTYNMKDNAGGAVEISMINDVVNEVKVGV